MRGFLRGNLQFEFIFDEASGTTFYNKVTANSNMTVPTRQVITDGPTSHGVNVTSTATAPRTSNTTAIAPSAGASFEMIIKSSSVASKYIMAWWTGVWQSGAMLLDTDSSGRLAIDIYGITTTRHTKALVNNVWAHVVVSMNYSGVTNTPYKISVNGITQTLNFVTGSVPSPNQRIELGYTTGYWGNFALFRAYNKILTDKEMAVLYQVSKGRFIY